MDINDAKAVVADSEERLLTPRDVEVEFGDRFPINRQVLARLHKRGTGPSYLRLNRRVFYPRSGVQEFLSGLVVPG